MMKLTRAELITKLRDPDYAGPYQHLRDWSEIDQLMRRAADLLQEAEEDEIVRDALSSSVPAAQPKEGTSDPIPLPEEMPSSAAGALRLCRDRFRAYEQSHEERGHLIKAAANGSMADMCERVLAADGSSIPAPVNVEMLLDKIEGLRCDLDSAVEVAFKRGATDWVRLNYPDAFNRLISFHPDPDAVIGPEQSRYHLIDPTVTIHTAAGWKTFGAGWLLISEAEYDFLSMTSAKFCESLTIDVQPREFGWAPGGYMIRCMDCGGDGFANGEGCDKRAIRCKPCALRMKMVTLAKAVAAGLQEHGAAG